MTRRRLAARAVAAGLALATLGALAADSWVKHQAAPALLPPGAAPHHAQTAIVLGALVYGRPGMLSPVLRDRVDEAIRLWKEGRVDTLLLSGDHGESDYDEVNWMRVYAEQHGVPRSKIFLDHAGFNTYETMVRARRVFQVNSAVVVTNGFHLPRAVFLARAQGMEVQGVAADHQAYEGAQNDARREFLARCKAVLNVYLWARQPLLGPPIPITGAAELSHDRYPEEESGNGRARPGVGGKA